MAYLEIPNEGVVRIQNATQLMGLNLEWFDYFMHTPGIESIGGAFVAPMARNKRNVSDFWGKKDPVLKLLWAAQPKNEHWEDRYVAHIEDILLTVARNIEGDVTLFSYRAVSLEKKIVITPELLRDESRIHWYESTGDDAFTTEESIDSCVRNFYMKNGQRQRMDIGKSNVLFQGNMPYVVNGTSLKGLNTLPQWALILAYRHYTLLGNLPDQDMSDAVTSYLRDIPNKKPFYDNRISGVTRLAETSLIEPTPTNSPFPVLPLMEFHTIL